MRSPVLLGFIIVVGCAALGTSPAWTPPLIPASTESVAIMETMLFTEVETKLHKVIHKGGNPLVQFLLRPNNYQVCACNVRGSLIRCACVTPEVGICIEPNL